MCSRLLEATFKARFRGKSKKVEALVMQLTCAEISKFRITTQRRISSRNNTMAKSKT